MAGWFAILFLLALMGAFALWRMAQRQRAATGLPRHARIVYADTGAWERVAQPLFARRYGLTGKPDYIVQTRDGTIPVEVKPQRVAPAPYDSDTLQLTAYALLLEETSGVTPEYGLLKYRDKTFQVEFTDELRARLLDTLAAMRRDWTAREVARSHTEPARCRACGYRAVCGQVMQE
jgi:CRISPR-associated exonuclease Cas4